MYKYNVKNSLETRQQTTVVCARVRSRKNQTIFQPSGQNREYFKFYIHII